MFLIAQDLVRQVQPQIDLPTQACILKIDLYNTVDRGYTRNNSNRCFLTCHVLFLRVATEFMMENGSFLNLVPPLLL